MPAIDFAGITESLVITQPSKAGAAGVASAGDAGGLAGSAWAIRRVPRSMEAPRTTEATG
jgi:hypothetical protein